jgi:S1-C subfamily serine protease
MSRLMFVYLSGTEKGKTRIFTQDHVTLGTSDACDLRLVPEEGGSLPDGVLADIYDDESAFHLVRRIEPEQFAITVNGEPLDGDQTGAGHPLHDGDTIHFGHGLSGVSLLFQVMPENFSAAHPVPRNVAGVDRMTSQSVHPLTATLFVKELTASLWAEIPRKAKLAGLTLVAAISLIILGVMAFSLVTLIRNANKTERLGEQISNLQSRREQDQDLIRKQQEEIERLRQTSEQMRQFTQRIAELYSPGVCLIVGSYSFVERGSGRVLRYETADGGGMPVDKDGNLQASVDGAGAPVRIDYTGTGFVVDDGVVATNKHVVQDWATDQVAQIILQQGVGLTPKLDALEAFFPSRQAPFELRVAAVSPRYDIALCRFDKSGASLPKFPLSNEDVSSTIGEPVVLLGYPTGVDGLLQRIDENERREILKTRGTSAVDVAAGLATRGLIRPLTTTGTISDALPGRIVHSAQTTEGGSGSPIFDRDGRVIAINSAILATLDGNQSFGGSNFGVPIKSAYELLQTLESEKPKPR